MPTSALQFESKLITFCAPTLTKLKTGSIFNIETEFEDLDECIHYYNQVFNQKGISISLIHKNERFQIIYVYQHDKIKHLFENHKCKEILDQYQYPCQNKEECLNWLKQRMCLNEFPHEIGLFLGYPFTDVTSFINGDQHQCIGYWKVYSHVSQAQKTFDRYRKCTCEMKRRFYNGKRIEELIRYI